MRELVLSWVKTWNSLLNIRTTIHDLNIGYVNVNALMKDQTVKSAIFFYRGEEVLDGGNFGGTQLTMLEDPPSLRKLNIFENDTPNYNLFNEFDKYVTYYEDQTAWNKNKPKELTYDNMEALIQNICKQTIEYAYSCSTPKFIIKFVKLVSTETMSIYYEYAGRLQKPVLISIFRRSAVPLRNYLEDTEEYTSFIRAVGRHNNVIFYTEK